MSDLSSPPLSLVPVDGDAGPAGAAEGFAWPTPPYACYAAPARLVEPEPCQIEGMNGRLMNGMLLDMDPAEGLAKVRIPPARIAIPLRFNQFRKLVLTRPLAPLDSAGADPLLAQRPAVDVRIRPKGAAPVTTLSIGHLEDDTGLFLFVPLDARGNVQRCFVPKAAYDGVDIGERIGEVLVAQNAATPTQIEQALAEQQQLRSQKLGEILLTKQVVTAEELEQAIIEQARMPMVRIGEALIALGFINQVQLEAALSQQREDRSVPLGELLVRRGLVSRPDLQTALARKMGYPLVDVTQFVPETEALARLPYAVAQRLPALPLLLRGGRLIVAVEDPSRPEVLDDIEFASQTKLVPVLARANLLPAAIGKAYERIGAATGGGAAGADAKIDFEVEEAGKLLATLEQQQSPDTAERDEPSIEQSDNSLVRLINSMIGEAQSQGVSDIHIECQPGRDKVKIRFRKDGALRPYMELPHTYRSAMIARIKIMCDLDISERRKPQDGKINFGKFVPGQRLELRVATIPTANGLEDAVLRLLASAKPIPLDNLGLSPANLGHIKAAAQRPYGMLLCVGPTGSGKTTTLHSVLGYINQPDRKIWTAEDPVEITQAGMRQVQVNPKIDWTFAKALRAFLRADPDVIMVGEIRDGETAKMAVEASLTGHLVMSTLHTNSAVETVTRLLDMGMDPFNFADSLLGVLAQRLVRRLCSKCIQSQEATKQQVDELLADYMHAFAQVEKKPKPDDVLAGWKKRFGKDGKLMHHFAKGCPNCDDSGLRGRAGLHELLVVSQEIRHLIQTGARPDELLRTALAEGLRTLRQDGIDKVWAGVSTIEEVRASSNA